MKAVKGAGEMDEIGEQEPLGMVAYRWMECRYCVEMIAITPNRLLDLVSTPL